MAAAVITLACPLTHQPLRPAPLELVASLNACIARRALRQASGDLVELPLDAGLIREDGVTLYPVRAGIPCLMADAGIALDAEEV